MNSFSVIAIAVVLAVAALNTNAASDAEKLIGVWEGTSAGVCSTRIQFQAKDFFAVNTNATGQDCGDGAGVYLGTYAYAGGSAVVNYNYKPEGSGVPASLIATLTFNGDDEFSFKFTVNNQEMTTVYTRLTADNLDGVWTGTAGDVGIVAQFIKGSFQLYWTEEGETSGNLGVFDIPSANNLDIQSYNVDEDEVEFTEFSATYNLNGNSLTMASQEMGFDMTLTRDSATVLEGSWVSKGSGACLQTLDFYSSVFRSYRQNCDDSGISGAYYGVAKIASASKLNVTFGFAGESDGSINDDLLGQTVVFTYTLSNAGETLRLQAQLEEPFDMTFSKVDAPPSFVAVTITLSGDINSFNVTAFVLDLASQLGVEPSNIVVISYKAGSVVVEVGLVETPGSPSSTDMLDAVEQLTSINGATVQSVEFVAGSASFASVSAWLLALMSAAALLLWN